MQNPLRFFSLGAVLVVGLPSAALAHPGHDGHELTWDFSHLVAHPLATVCCLAVLAASVWLGWRLTRHPAKSAAPLDVRARH